MTGPFPVRSPLASRTALLTYEPYYGLKEKPFSLSVDPRFLYKSRSHAPIYDDLLAGIRRREGLIVLTGDIGTGKTTLCRAVLEGLDRKTFSTFVPDPFVSREDLLKMLLIDFGVMSVDDLKSGRLNGASRPDLSYPLYEFLNSLVPLQAFAVLIIDEAQNLSLPLLEEIRILSDLEAPEKLLQVVLVGQLEFQAKLKHPDMRQVDQRVSVRCNLEPLDREAVSSYIAHRLQVAGGTRDRVSFGPAAVDVIAQRSGGVPRLINLICDRSLHRGHLARTSLIDADIARVAIIDLGLAEASSPAIPTEIRELPAAPPASYATYAPPEPQPAQAPSSSSASSSSASTSTPSTSMSSAALAPPPGMPAASAFDAKKLFEPSDSRYGEKPEEIVFQEHDLIHADHALPLDPPQFESTEPDPENTTVPAAPGDKTDKGDRPLLFESRGSAWAGQTSPQGRRRWRRRTRRVAGLLVAIAIVLGGSYWQSQFDETTEVITAPEPPPSPLEGFALNFQPRRRERIPLTPDANAGAPAITPDVTLPDPSAGVPAVATSPVAPPVPAPAGMFAIDVALFNSNTRASRLVTELIAANHHAYIRDVDLGDRGHLFEVMVGPFASRADADAELAKIHAIPGYEDARIAASAQ